MYVVITLINNRMLKNSKIFSKKKFFYTRMHFIRHNYKEKTFNREIK